MKKKIATAAAALALSAAILAVPHAAACSYQIGATGRTVRPASVGGLSLTSTNDNEVEIWFSDAEDGDDWFYYCAASDPIVHDLHIGRRVTLVINGNGTPDDLTDDYPEDVLYCNDCGSVED